MYAAIKTETFAKLFFLISVTGLLMYAILAFYTFHTGYTTVSDYELFHTNGLPNAKVYSSEAKFENELKYILQWTIPTFNVSLFGEGQEPFVKHNCEYSNCYITTDMSLLNEDYRNFEALILPLQVLRSWRKVLIPERRHLEQKFIFYGMKSSNETPICQINADNFFNWTWSYKLSSDVVTPFIEIRDLKGNFIAPDYNVHWTKNWSRLSKEYVDKLKTKKKAVAWIMDTCKAKTIRMVFVKALQNALKEHSLELDVFTNGCGSKSCPNDDCVKVVERDYYFYLAFESSHGEDYVTNEVLKAYNHDTVPIVKNGADNRLFLPEGSYLDAQQHSVKTLASIIHYSIVNPEVYHDLHRWRNHYIIKEADPMRGICDLCQLLHTEAKFKTYSTYKSFRRWWYNGDLGERCLPKGSESMVDILSYLNNTKIPYSRT